MRRSAFILVFVVVILLASSDAFKRGEKGKHKPKPPKPVKPAEDVKIDILATPPKCERKSKPGDVVSVHYSGRLQDGTLFDSSLMRGTPFTFRLGMGQVILGWEKGLQQMCVGEKRKLTIPPSYAYGEAGHPPVIPASATLLFEVELVEFDAPMTPPPSPPVQSEEDIPFEV